MSIYRVFYNKLPKFPYISTFGGIFSPVGVNAIVSSKGKREATASLFCCRKHPLHSSIRTISPHLSQSNSGAPPRAVLVYRVSSGLSSPEPARLSPSLRLPFGRAELSVQLTSPRNHNSPRRPPYGSRRALSAGASPRASLRSALPRVVGCSGFPCPLCTPPPLRSLVRWSVVAPALARGSFTPYMLSRSLRVRGVLRYFIIAERELRTAHRGAVFLFIIWVWCRQAVRVVFPRARKSPPRSIAT
jgi:hypothetical protein